MQAPPESEGATPRRRGKGPSWLVIGVVAIGACLATCLGTGTKLFAPIYFRVAAAGQNRGCETKLHRIASAVDLYATDFDDTLPAAVHWMDTLTKYLPADSRFIARGHPLDRIFKCPTVPTIPPGKYGYAMWAKVGGRKRSSLRELSTLPVVFDSEQLTYNAVSATPDPPAKGRHMGKNNFLFLDGHVKALAPGDRPWISARR